MRTQTTRWLEIAERRTLPKDQGPLSKAYLFSQQGDAGPGGEVSGLGESRAGCGIFGEEVAPLFPQFYRTGDDRLAHPESPKEA